MMGSVVGAMPNAFSCTIMRKPHADAIRGLCAKNRGGSVPFHGQQPGVWGIHKGFGGTNGSTYTSRRGRQPAEIKNKLPNCFHLPQMESGELNKHTFVEPPFAELGLIYHGLIAEGNYDIYHFEVQPVDIRRRLSKKALFYPLFIFFSNQ